MRDAVTLARQGLPVVQMVAREFEPLARSLARGLKMPDLPLAVTAWGGTGDLVGDWPAVAAEVTESVAQQLTNPVARPASS